MADPVTKHSFVGRLSGDRLIRVLVANRKGKGFHAFTISETEVQGVAERGQERSALVLRSGSEIPVALPYEDLEQKIFRPNFRTDVDLLDLRDVTGEIAKPFEVPSSALKAAAKINRAPSTTPASVVDPGGEMPDGMIFAGISPDTNKRMYTTRIDVPLTMTFNEARAYVGKMNKFGHKDWRVPTKAELNVLFNNRADIGGFDTDSDNPAGWYWSSSETVLWGAWVQRFTDGAQLDRNKSRRFSVRAVR